MATVNWREELKDEVDPDDELLDETPPEVIDVLGFDPLEFEPTANQADCGAGVEGSPGFQPGNTCGSLKGRGEPEKLSISDDVYVKKITREDSEYENEIGKYGVFSVSGHPNYSDSLTSVHPTQSEAEISGHDYAIELEPTPQDFDYGQTTASFKWYQSEGYDEINRALRKDNVVPGSVTETHVNAMDDAFAEEPVLEISRVAKDGKLYRGSKTAQRFLDQAGYDLPRDVSKSDLMVSDSARKNVEEIVKKAKGVRFTDKGYVSTSEDREVAGAFSGIYKTRNARNMGAIFQITGQSKMIDLETMTREDIGEKEMLLDRGHTFEIKDARIAEFRPQPDLPGYPIVEFDAEIVN